MKSLYLNDMVVNSFLK